MKQNFQDSHQSYWNASRTSPATVFGSFVLHLSFDLLPHFFSSGRLPAGRMGEFMDLFELSNGHMGVDLGCGQVGMTGSRIILEAQATENESIVSITDEGIGISAQHIDKIFDRFYRLEAGVAHRRGGTGLGLSICKAIVEEHGGRVWAESEMGKGSKFSFSLLIYEEV